ncbi:MAG: sulfotransferase family protein [Rhodobacteraceae bacterium]|nr:sulfotransferase family protein [Paracoccaceae bacterium]
MPKRLKWGLRFGDHDACLVYVHIGKCGGASLWSAIRKSDRIANSFRSVRKIHVEKPPILKRARYAIVLRNPVVRAVSAFNWRYKLVVEDGKREKFPNEREILKKYQTINTLSENLYDADGLNTQVAHDFNHIHHLHENISFYLTDLLKSVSREQIFFVLSTETLDADVAALTGIKKVARIHENAHKTDTRKKALTTSGRANLKRFLADDYQAIEDLLSLNHTTQTEKNVLLT